MDHVVSTCENDLSGPMNLKMIERDGYRMLLVDASGPRIETARDATALLEQAFERRASVVVVPVERLAEAFFRLRSGVAGEILQKFVNYQIKFAVIGDISAYTAASDALRDFVRESNRGTSILFAPAIDALAAKLSGR
jgi:Domain of unknown function (DUF4180)